MPLALTGATGLHRAIRTAWSCEGRLQAERLAAQPAFDVDATCECGNWQPKPRKKYVSSARLRRDLDDRSAVRTQYEIALNAIIVINTTAKPQPNNIVLL
jgi:hypothetical protein